MINQNPKQLSQKWYQFECGCKFPIIKELPGYSIPLLDIDYYKYLVPNSPHFTESCPKVWENFANGLTLGVFQLESGLGKKWTKELKPTCIEHLAALGSILRPGALNNLDEEGVSVTQHYCDRKNLKEEIVQPIKALEPILKNTYQLLVYQESAIAIGKEIAGFDEGTADFLLRKNIGKKNAKLLFEAETQFVDGAVKLGKVTKDEAITIFSWIKASARYAFNKCVTLDTLVETPTQFKTVDELNIGDWVKGPTEDYSNTEFIEVLDKIDCGEQHVYEITLESGKTITCTFEHKFLCEDDIIRPLYEIIENNYSIKCELD